MRLLERKSDGDVVFREFTSKDVPAYAVLSHTWLTNNDEEVSFQNVEAGIGKNKAGWRKIQFCADKAAADGLRYFWIDTCCIDKKNSIELSKAINSMYRWYQKAARCYVYLADVSAHDGKETPQQYLFPWEATFRKSLWFTRGWTLQELLAPTSVDFFSLEGERLGSKLTLEDIIHDITGIPRAALKGGPLDGFSRDDRMSWASHRHTKEEEDQAYSLLDIFDVSMPLIYGEGTEKAYTRLQEQIEKFYKGDDSDQFAVGFDLSAIPEAVQFVARENELAEMRRFLQDHKSRSAVVLYGLGGIGKTQLAIKYATRHKQKYTAIFWLNANDEDSLKLSFRHIAQRVLEDQNGRPSTSALASVDLDGNLDQVVMAVKTWLNLPRNTRWLMIYDNYDNPWTTSNLDPTAFDIRRFLPQTDHGSVIITTRSAQVSQGHPIHVQKLKNTHESLDILSNTSRRENIENDPDAIALAKELYGLPLALSAAGAYLEHVTTSFADYLRLYKASWLKLQMTSPQLSSYEDRLYTTWQITFDRIEQQNVASAKLLKLWAYFDRQDVWFELLRHMKSADDEWIQKLTEDELNFNEAVALLCSFGLVDTDRSLQQQSGTGGYSVHSCVHSWTVFVLNKEWDEGLARLALTCVASKVPSANEKDWWLLQRRLLQHATRQDLFIVDGKVDVGGLNWAFHNLGGLYSKQGKLVEAEKMYIRALQDKEEALGQDHLSTLNTINNLGTLYTYQGKLAEAEKMYIRALQGREEALGPDHISTLDTVNNLGALYANQGKLAEAEKIYIRALQGYEEALGPDHISTLDTVNNLGVLYKNQGKLAEAEKMYIRALGGYEEALGVELVSSYLPALNTMSAFGDLYSQTDRKDMAKVIYTRALSGYAAIQGPSSERCRIIEGRLQALQLTPAETETQHTPAKTGTPETKSRRQRLFRRLRT